MAGETNTCTCCNAPTEAHKLINCSICKKLYNHSCVDLTLSEARTIKSKKNVNWTCRNCSLVGNDINELKAIILELKNEVADLKSQRNIQVNNNSAYDMEEIIQEISDRDRRKRNLIIHGIKELSGATKNERLSHDTVKVAEVLTVFSANSISSPMRLGKFDNSRSTPRPIKVTLPDEETVHRIIHNIRNIKDNDQFKNISISLDRTPKQIAYYMTIKKQLVDRIQRGEKDLKIKHIRGIPSIISVNEPLN